MAISREERFEKLRAGEIMIPLARYPKVAPEATLRDAMVALSQAQLDMSGCKSLPRVVLVVDGAGALVGLVRRRDIMRGLEPPFLAARPMEHREAQFVAGDPALVELAYNRVVEGVRKQAKRAVHEVMKPIPATVDASANVVRAIYTMVNNRTSLLPVVQGSAVVGVLRSVELLEELRQLVV
jgi:CBS domain-containing protein